MKIISLLDISFYTVFTPLFILEGIKELTEIGTESISFCIYNEKNFRTSGLYLPKKTFEIFNVQY